VLSHGLHPVSAPVLARPDGYGAIKYNQTTTQRTTPTHERYKRPTPCRGSIARRSGPRDSRRTAEAPRTDCQWPRRRGSGNHHPTRGAIGSFGWDHPQCPSSGAYPNSDPGVTALLRKGKRRTHQRPPFVFSGPSLLLIRTSYPLPPGAPRVCGQPWSC
jgi:hypothetical protein